MSSSHKFRVPAFPALLVLGLVAIRCHRTDPPPPETHEAPGPPTVPTASAAAAAAPPSETAPRPPLARPFNVVLILIDSLRADMPWNGYPRDIAPRLSAYAATAVNYPNAYALSPYTAKSVGGLLAGRYPSEMPRTAKFFTRWPDADNVFVSEVIRDAGHGTLGGHAHGYFSPQLEINQGFTDWRILPNIVLGVQAGTTGDRHAALAKKMLSEPGNVSQDDGRRFFAYFHFMDPHHTYEAHAETPRFGSGSLRDQYDHEVAWTDRWVGEVLDFIDAEPWGKHTAVIISADHGESFGEHGHVRHGYEIWQSVVHVPLLIRIPGVEPRRIERFRSHIDLARTILDLMDVPAPESFRGVSLIPEVTGGAAAPRVVVIDLPRCDLQDRRRAILTDDGYKLIAFGDEKRFMLFHVLRDPKESDELSTKEPEMFERMKRLYAEESARIPVVEVIGNEALKGAPAGRRW
jgi:choline-sulfatase